MITLHCIDVSGSMSKDQLLEAQKEMLNRFKPKDITVVFNLNHMIVTDHDRPLDSYLSGYGGTDPSSTLKYAQSLGAKTILYSDGFLLSEDLAKFDEVVTV